MSIINLRILYFAAARERARCQEEQVTLAPPHTLNQLKHVLYQRHVELSSLDDYLRWAINQRFSESDDLILKEGDEVALIPPISGG